MTDRTHYEVLGADEAGSKADVKAAYQEALDAARSTGDAEEVARVRRAWQVLSDPVQRQRYDDELGVTGGSGQVARRSQHDVEVLEDEDVDDDGGISDVGAAGGPMRGSIPPFLEQPTVGRRLTASLIDVVTALVLFLVTISLTFLITDADGGTAGIITFVVWVEIWVVVLFVIPTYRTGQTLGKRLTYVMVVDRATGDLPPLTQVIRRYTVPIVAIPALFQLGAFLALFSGLSYAMGREQISLSDRLARTAVVVARYTPTRSGAAR